MAFKLHPKAKIKGEIEIKDVKLTTGELRLSYPHLFKPNKFEGSDKESWSCQLLVSKDEDIGELERIAHNAAIKEWGPDTSKWPSKKIKSKKHPGKFITKSLVKMPFRDGDEEKPDHPEYENMTFFSASRNTINFKGEEVEAPQVVDRSREPIESSKKIKAGDYVRVSIIAIAYETGKNIGVKFYLNMVQKLRNGEPLGNSGSPENEFDDLEELDEELDEDNEDENEEEGEEEEGEEEDEEETRSSKKSSKKKYSY